MIRQSARLIWLVLAPLLRRGNKWTRMAARRQDATFWLTRDRFDRLRFKFLRALLRRRRALGEGISAVVVAKGIGRAIRLPVLAAAVSVVLLAWFDQTLASGLLDGMGDAERTTAFRAVSTSLERALNGWAAALVPGQPAEEAHATLLVAGAQVTGVFLGLYFTAISVVARTYGNARSELRSVLIEDEVGNVYLALVGFTGAACLFALGALALGYSLGPASAVVFAFLGSASVLSFLLLGKRVFGLLDPEAVTNSLARDVTVAVKSVSGTGMLASNASIQAHHQKVAARSLGAWEELVSVAVGRSQSASSLQIIGQNAVSLLLWYSSAKFAIPKTSWWFRRRYTHPSSLVAGSSELSVASRTGWSMPPRVESDELWFERRIGEILQAVIAALLNRGSDRCCAELLGSFQHWVVGSAHRLSVSEMEMGFQIASRIGSTTHRSSTGTCRSTERDKLDRLALLDGVAQTVSAAAGALNSRLSSQPFDQLLSAASNAASQHSLSLAEFPPNARKSIEAFRNQHSFERDIEGSILTPSWFVQHYVARLMSVDVRTTFGSLLTEAEQSLVSFAKSLRENGEVEASALVIQRGVETVLKLEASATKTQGVLETLKGQKVDAAGTEWPDVDTAEWNERLRLLHGALLGELIQLTPRLRSDPPSGDLPDSFGFAYTTLCDAAVTALEGLDAATFELVYPVLVLSALRAHDRVRSELAESPAESMLFLSADVIIGVLEISGYAYLWKFALGENEYWDRVTSVWDRLLSDHPKPVGLIKTIVLEAAFHKEHLAISPRSETRWQWKRRVKRQLDERGFAPQDLTPSGTPRVISVDWMAASCIRSWDMCDARDLMISEYVLRRAEAQGLDLTRGVEDLREGAERVSANRAAGVVEGVSGLGGEGW